MSFDWSTYSLEQLRSHAITTFREGAGTRPDVLLIEIDGNKAVLKDQNGADALFALLIGPLLNWRECKALKRLEKVECVPDLLCQPDRRSFLMTYHESEQLTRLDKFKPDWPIFFALLTDAVAELHRAGVAHNDLRNPTNTLVNAQGQPILVDLVACFLRGSKYNKLNHLVFNKFKQVDLSAITKMKHRVAPELLTSDDIHADEIAGKAGMMIKGFGQLIRRLSRLLFTQK